MEKEFKKSEGETLSTKPKTMAAFKLNQKYADQQTAKGSDVVQLQFGKGKSEFLNLTNKDLVLGDGTKVPVATAELLKRVYDHSEIWAKKFVTLEGDHKAPWEK